jgi:hypothetical protein
MGDSVGEAVGEAVATGGKVGIGDAIGVGIRVLVPCKKKAIASISAAKTTQRSALRPPFFVCAKRLPPFCAKGYINWRKNE